MSSNSNVFAVPVFLVVFREALETVIIVSILLAFLKQTLDGPQKDARVYKALRKQVISVSSASSWLRPSINHEFRCG